MSDDSHTWDCPDCDKPNKIGATRCQCGYVLPANTNPVAPNGRALDPKRCAYVSSTGRQCPLPKGLSSSCAPNRQEYCTGHYHHPTGMDAENVFMDVEENYKELIAKDRNNFHHLDIDSKKRLIDDESREKS